MLKLLNNPLVAFVLTLAAIGFWLSLLQTSNSIRRSSETLKVLEQEVAETARDVSQLQHQLELAEDPFTQEKIARDEMLLQQPGEIVLKLSQEPQSNQNTEAVADVSAWHQWRELLF